MKRRYSRFIAGESIDLCVPSETAIADGWADWFNDPAITRNLAQGVFPNTEASQRAFLAALDQRERLALLITDPEGQHLWGTVSLSSIDWIERSAQLAIVLGKTPREAPLAALEAIALLAQHGIETLRLDRIWCGQAYPFSDKFTHRMTLLGFRAEGIDRLARSGGDVLRSALMRREYESICAERDYWPGSAAMRSEIRRLPRRSLAARVVAAIEREHAAYELELKGPRLVRDGAG